jgi:hypothetical protein
MDLQEIGLCMDRIDLPQGTDIWQAVVNATMNIWIS